tara:strand:+ start:2728 stop:3765 length:1038 start_codon:yes stop_codon:yes gene_type:complete
MGLARKINMSDDKVVPFKISEQPDIKKKNYKDQRLLIVMPFNAWQDKRLSHLQIRVLMGFCSYTKKTGQVFNDNNDSAMTYVSQKRIAEEMGISRQTINKSVKKLRECGYIVFEGKTGIPGLKGKTMRIVFGRNKKEKATTLPQIKALLSSDGDYRDKTDKEIEDQEILEKIKKGEIKMKLTSGTIKTHMQRLQKFKLRNELNSQAAKLILKKLKDSGENVDKLLKEHEIIVTPTLTPKDEVCKPNDKVCKPNDKKVSPELNSEVDTNNGINNVYITYSEFLNKYKIKDNPTQNETDQLLTSLLLEKGEDHVQEFIRFMEKELGDGCKYVSYTRLLESFLSNDQG